MSAKHAESCGEKDSYVEHSPAKEMLIFDGDCGFCTVSARWAERYFKAGEVAAAWQSLGTVTLGGIGLSLDDVRLAAWWIDSKGRRERGHRAVGRALKAGGGWRSALGTMCLVAPTSWLAAVIYQAVVRWRYLLPGSTESCRRDPNL
ncbi:MAG: DUF393 domain-containing protein [Gallionella sp.]|nr:DUF393 domain-containing protein [Gallionella sp.]